MTTLAIEQETNNYWKLLKNVSKEVKVALISKLSASLITDNEEHKINASQFAGIWNDEDYLDSDEINSLIKNERKFKKDIEAL
ncbi:MAG: hypothetical protein IKK92_13510 [Prevotella sp.]|nr:hypothetical protein [Prevotella sp.]MBQ2951328.1 hypothetical protein [Prevotella sp.]MBR2034848.1 hypothetical protein [Prevotella sp.]MBR6591216.1 hypothetical protein [Prevotella sp.]MBR6606858.1 hypothetical protein [Prevotella sp.]